MRPQPPTALMRPWPLLAAVALAPVWAWAQAQPSGGAGAPSAGPAPSPAAPAEGSSLAFWILGILVLLALIGFLTVRAGRRREGIRRNTRP